MTSSTGARPKVHRKSQKGTKSPKRSSGPHQRCLEHYKEDVKPAPSHLAGGMSHLAPARGKPGALRASAAHSHAALSIADAFFFDELTTNVGYAEAAHWLGKHAHAPGAGRRSGAMSSTCSSVSSPLSSPRRPNDAALPGAFPAPTSPCLSANAGNASEMSELAMGLGADGGLLYTDAAHMVLEGSPRSPRRPHDGSQRKPKLQSSLSEA